MRPGTVWALLVIWCPITTQAVAQADIPAGYRRVAAEAGMPPSILYAVALTESGRTVDSAGSTRPWPWTLNVAGRGAFYGTRKEAFDVLKRLLAGDSESSVDVGLMQINWRYHRSRLGTPSRALDPQINLRVATQILKACLRRGQDWWRAVGCYHAPNDPDRAARYRKRVFAHWQRLIERGPRR